MKSGVLFTILNSTKTPTPTTISQFSSRPRHPPPLLMRAHAPHFGTWFPCYIQLHAQSASISVSYPFPFLALKPTTHGQLLQAHDLFLPPKPRKKIRFKGQYTNGGTRTPRRPATVIWNQTSQHLESKPKLKEGSLRC